MKSSFKTPNSIFKVLFGHNYYYDDTGIIGMKYGGQHYYFVKNLFGDVIEIWDANGTYVGGYGYDAYGNTKVADRTAANIATVNPFRYRGYYQDGIGSTDSVYFDKGLYYYLKSRYYDPSILSFISADDPTMALLGAGQIGGTNLYAYCNYDPINYTDPGGNFPVLLTVILGGSALIGMITGGIIANKNDATSWETFKYIMLGGTLGLAAGGLIVATGGAFAAVFGTASLATPFLGVTAIKAFAIGALSYNVFAFGVAPLIGISINGIEMGSGTQHPTHPDQNPPVHSPGFLRMQSGVEYYYI